MELLSRIYNSTSRGGTLKILPWTLCSQSPLSVTMDMCKTTIFGVTPTRVQFFEMEHLELNFSDWIAWVKFFEKNFSSRPARVEFSSRVSPRRFFEPAGPGRIFQARPARVEFFEQARPVSNFDPLSGYAGFRFQNLSQVYFFLCFLLSFFKFLESIIVNACVFSWFDFDCNLIFFHQFWSRGCLLCV